MHRRKLGENMGGALQNESGGLGDGVPQKLKHFCKYKPSNLRPRENYFNNNNNNNRLSLTFVFSPWDLYSLGHKK